MRKERINEIWAVFFLLVGLYTLASLAFFKSEDLPFYTSHPNIPVQNYTGIIGAYLSFGMLITFGASAYLIPVLFLLWSVCFFSQKVPEKKLFKILGLGIALASTSTLVAISFTDDARFERGGAIGYLAATHLVKYFGVMGSCILALSCLLLSLLLATDFLIYPLLKSLLKKIKGTGELFSDVLEKIRCAFSVLAGFFIKDKIAVKTQKISAFKSKSPEAVRAGALRDLPIKVKQYRPDLPENDKFQSEALKKEVLDSIPKEAKEKLNVGVTLGVARESGRAQGPPLHQPEVIRAKAEEESAHFEGVIGSAATGLNYQFPPLDLLRRPDKSVSFKGDNLQENSRILESTLAEFGIEVKVIEVEQGPVITRYELLPAPGVKVNSIAALSDDIALAMKAMSVRLIIPIPGKSAVGVEVPNSVSSAVNLRELVDTSLFRSKKFALPLALGKDTSGKPLIADLTSMPHIIIAGTTGSGKTVCVNSIITGLLYNCSPEDLKLVMVDPKMVELAVYNKIPHMLSPVVTDVKKAAHTLNWVVTEMENRYKLLATVGVRNIQAFNSRPLAPEDAAQIANTVSENVIPIKLPYIIVIIDELADLMMVAQDKVEGAITRLAQLSRAVGIHLILATQRPSVDVITGVIKANFPARISFKVAAKVDSRTVLDTSGADKLIGKGDMLFLQPGDSKPTRGQAAFVTDAEINAVVKFVSEQARPEYHPEIQSAQEGKGAGGVLEKDELFDEAVAVVLETGQASTSNLQRRLRLGYTRAARIIDQMEAAGIIGPQQGAKPRDILIDRASSEEPLAKAE
ncbi:MAG: DNA translocase FtsK 4TM domain-containing protein [Candidatus Omnitrophica bacterium]|nr:DNA translocase FtsK 4TM domain-containing protein [Candidatus Omnitrophota bacterium]